MSDKNNQTIEELEKIQEESVKQEMPDQGSITGLSAKIRKRLNNLPDPKNPPLGYDDHKAFDRVFPYVNIPALHPMTNEDTVVFNDPNAEPNKLYLGDNLEVLRTLKSESIDLIYIDPPFFSGRNYNVIWGDSNEVRTFGDIWEGGISSYLIWLNARLWEMRRVLKKTGSIYVHCDWHASHYIKTEMDKIFGYENFMNEIVWAYSEREVSTRHYNRKHDIILFYAKSANNESRPFNFKEITHEYSTGTFLKFNLIDKDGRRYQIRGKGGPYTGKQGLNPEIEKKYPDWTYRDYLDEKIGILPRDWITDIGFLNRAAKERIGYPTQKPEPLLERIIRASSNSGDKVADFFIGGGTTCAVAKKLGRNFIGCDSSRVAISVTLDRLVKIGEQMSGIKSNVSYQKGENFQLGLQAQGLTEKVPNIEVNYLGVYPVEKFKNLNQDDFVDFVLTAYGASRNSGGGVISGYKAPAQQEPVLVGPADPSKSVDNKVIKKFFKEVLERVEPNKAMRPKIIAWRFSRQCLAYIRVLQKYCEKNNLPIDLEAMPLESQEFRKRILQRMPDLDESELFLRFSKAPIIGEIKINKIGNLEYEFTAIDTFSNNEDGWLVNCQWDFDYQEGHFTADKSYILSREKKRDPKRGEIFEAILQARYKFENPGEYTIACKVQDNLAGETILPVTIKVT